MKKYEKRTLYKGQDCIKTSMFFKIHDWKPLSTLERQKKAIAERIKQRHKLIVKIEFTEGIACDDFVLARKTLRVSWYTKQ